MSIIGIILVCLVCMGIASCATYGICTSWYTKKYDMEYEEDELRRNRWKYSTILLTKSYLEMLRTSKEAIEGDSNFLEHIARYIGWLSNQTNEIDMPSVTSNINRIKSHIEDRNAVVDLLTKMVNRDIPKLDNQINELLDIYSKEHLEK